MNENHQELKNANTNPDDKRDKEQPTFTRDFGHTVVIGCSIAGLAAARVLSDYFARVTIVERDELPAGPDFRRGAPQARHAHILLPRGQRALERYFPGLIDELLAQGAVAVDAGKDIALFEDGEWCTPKVYGTRASINFSRPLLEAALHRRIAALPQVEIVQRQEAAALQVDEQGQRVTGLALRDRHSADAGQSTLATNLVVDASGRQSRAPQWLQSLGYPPPEEWHVNAFVGYASRLYQIAPTFSDSWKTLLIRPAPPDGTRGGIVVAVEDGRWCVTLIGVDGDYPPTNTAEFLAFARSLPTPRLYEAIKEAVPLSEPVGYRLTDNRVRRYERLPRYLEGFLVCGDAAFALNPIYAQGMTAAVTGSLALDQVLKTQRRQNTLTGLAGAFQKKLGESVAPLWHMATKQEWDWSMTEVTDNTDKEM